MDSYLMIRTEGYVWRWHILLVVTFMVTVISSLEEPNPEIFLRPRNFNPHPYEVGGRRQERNGPVVFPANPEDGLVDNESNFVTPRNIFRESHPVDNHPYVKVAKKHKYKVVGRFGNQENRANARVYQALAKHAVKVLSYPPEELGKYVPRKQGKNYEFSYKVVDHLTGDDFSHSQSRNSKATNGEYRVKLPDGRVQIVSYTADKNGYKADVKYTENEGDAVQRGTPHQGHVVDIERIPVRELHPVVKEKSFDYQGGLPHHHNNVVLLQAVLPSQIPRNLNNHGDIAGIVVSPSPSYFNTVSGNLQVQPHPKVEIYTTNARDYSIGSYIPSTVTPRISKNINDYARTISPQISNNGNLGLSVPSTASSFVVTDQHGQVLDNIKLVSSTASPLIVGNQVASTTAAPILLNDGHYILSTVVPHF